MNTIIRHHFDRFAKTFGTHGVPSDEAFLAGWDACRRHYDGIPPTKYEVPTEAENRAAAIELYQAYPRHIGRGAALKAILNAMKLHTVPVLSHAVNAYAAAVKRWPAVDRALYVPHPATWFNRESYLDDPQEWERGAFHVNSIKVEGGK